ncbi:hypothetical protein EBH_0043810 [Eimeria brunetti]|uniref:Uncharacterized protein n=1 Tax=Eimeria brunetti TaxID=51314 RepID=U6LSW7_9EIME|nr:hypothetical protein EBH_0043810 [Eimeria brunetti]
MLRQQHLQQQQQPLLRRKRNGAAASGPLDALARFGSNTKKGIGIALYPSLMGVQATATSEFASSVGNINSGSRNKGRSVNAGIFCKAFHSFMPQMSSLHVKGQQHSQQQQQQAKYGFAEVGPPPSLGLRCRPSHHRAALLAVLIEWQVSLVCSSRSSENIKGFLR